MNSVVLREPPHSAHKPRIGHAVALNMSKLWQHYAMTCQDLRDACLKELGAHRVLVAVQVGEALEDLRRDGRHRILWNLADLQGKSL